MEGGGGRGEGFPTNKKARGVGGFGGRGGILPIYSVKLNGVVVTR